MVTLAGNMLLANGSELSGTVYYRHVRTRTFRATSTMTSYSYIQATYQSSACIVSENNSTRGTSTVCSPQDPSEPAIYLGDDLIAVTPGARMPGVSTPGRQPVQCRRRSPIRRGRLATRNFYAPSAPRAAWIGLRYRFWTAHGAPRVGLRRGSGLDGR